MTRFENTLTEILTEEARRHEAPAFDAYAIADRSGAARASRRSRFALAAGITAAAAVSAGAVYGLTGEPRTTPGGGASGPRLTMAFARSVPDDSSTTLAHLKQVVQARAAAAGIRTWKVDESAGTATVTVAGAPGDRDRLANIVAPGFLSIRPVVDPATFGLAAWATDGCAKPLPPEVEAKMTSSGLNFACDPYVQRRILVGPSQVTGGKVASAKAVEEVTSQGAATGQWAVDLTFSPDGTKDAADLISDAYRGGTQIAFVADGTSYSEETVTEGSLYFEALVAAGPITGGHAKLTGVLSRQTAERIAAAVNAGPLPGDFKLVRESTTP
jgi:hypothetical protein